MSYPFTPTVQRRSALAGMALGILCFLRPGTLCSQAPLSNFEKPALGGEAMADQYNWSRMAMTAVEGAGIASVSLQPGDFVLPDGAAFTPLRLGRALAVDSGTQAETVVPTAVDCPPGGPVCSFMARFEHAHGARFAIASATGGLQEAIDAMPAAGGTVVITPAWSGGSIGALALVGRSGVLIEDRRGGSFNWWEWNGSAFSTLLSIGGGAVRLADAVSAGPWLDVRAFGASGSAAITTATCTAASTVVTLGAAQDFANGNGIALSGCGAAAFGGASITAPAPTVVNWCGLGGQMACANAPGATSYNYKIAVDDGAEGYTAAGAAGTTTTGAATLATSCCNQVGGANYLTWSAPANLTTNSYGYFVYGQKGSGAWNLIGMATIPGDAIPWFAARAYPNGSYVTPRAAPNGSFYVAVTGGTSGGSEPNWCTSSATCAVIDGSVTWERQPFSWMDVGNTVNYQPAWIPTTPPGAGASDALVTTVAAGGGTTSLTLGTAAVTSAAAGLTVHDDTAALSAALAAQNAGCVPNQPAGSSPAAACRSVWIPAGNFNTTAPLVFDLWLRITGESTAWVNGEEPFQPLFSSAAASGIDFASLHTQGGLDALYVRSAASDNSIVRISGVTVRFTTGYALSLGTQEGGGAGLTAAGMSASVDGSFYGDRRLAYLGGDWGQFIPNTWVEDFPANKQPYEAEVTAAAGASVALHGVVGVPSVLPYDRWVDDWSAASVVIDQDSRLGGEGGGMSAVYMFGGYGAGQAFHSALATQGLGAPFNWLGSSIVIRDSMQNSANVGVVTALNNSFPQNLTLGSNYWSINSGIVDTCSGVNDGTFATEPCALPAGFGGTNLDTIAEGALGRPDLYRIRAETSSNLGPLCVSGRLQPALLPFVESGECRQIAAAPTAGVWTAGGSVGANSVVPIMNAMPSPGAPMGWVAALGAGPNLVGERAAPAWQAAHTYTLATTAAGEGADFVQATVGGTAYSFYVSGVGSGSACTSGGTAPVWQTAVNSSTGAGAITTDGTCTWTVESVGSEASQTLGYVSPYTPEPVATFLQLAGLPMTATTGVINGTGLSASCDTGAVSVPNARVGSVVSVATTDGSDIGGAFDVRGSVTAPGTVTVYVCGTGTPPSKAYNVTVQQ
ncbi:MAG TPA: hypothetical protein VN709_12155 [Terriglobales bacterium]|nr:hypothetical protein [Terriglobales bacterium]